MIWQFWALFFVAFVLGAALAVAFCWLGQLRDANLRTDPPTQALTGTTLQATTPSSTQPPAALESPNTAVNLSSSGRNPEPATLTSQATATRSIDLKDVHPSLIPGSTAQLATIPGGGTLSTDTPVSGNTDLQDASTEDPKLVEADAPPQNALLVQALAERDQAQSLAQAFETDLKNLRLVHSALANAHDKLTARFEKIEHQRRYAMLDRHRMQEQINQLEKQLSERTAAQESLTDELQMMRLAVTPNEPATSSPENVDAMGQQQLSSVEPQQVHDDSANIPAAAITELEAKLSSVSTTNQQLAERLVLLESLVEATQHERDAASDQIQAYQDTIRELETSVQDARMALDSAISDWSLRFDQLQAQHDTDAAELERLLLSRKGLDQQIEAAREQADQAKRLADSYALAAQDHENHRTRLQAALDQSQQELSEQRAVMDALQRHCVHLENERTRMLSVFGQFTAGLRPFMETDVAGDANPHMANSSHPKPNGSLKT